VAYVGVVGGKSEDDTIERVLSAMLSSRLASQYNPDYVKPIKYKKIR